MLQLVWWEKIAEAIGKWESRIELCHVRAAIDAKNELNEWQRVADINYFDSVGNSMLSEFRPSLNKFH